MAEPFIGEICCFGFTFSPRDWAKCNGQLLPISQFSTLFAVIGTTYGGDGQTTFALPNLQGSIPMHWGSSAGFNTQIGEVQGSSTVALTVQQIPQHNHAITVVSIPSDGTSERAAVPTNAAFLSGSRPPNQPWQNPPQSVVQPFSPKAISYTGGTQGHENMQPFLTLNFCISLYGVFPSRN